MNTAITSAIAIAGIATLVGASTTFMIENSNESLLPFADLEILNQRLVNFPGAANTALLQMKIVNTGDLQHEGYTITCYDAVQLQSVTNIVANVDPGKDYDISEIILGNYIFYDSQFCEIGVTVNSVTNFVRSGFYVYNE